MSGDGRTVIHHDYREGGLTVEAQEWIEHASNFHSHPERAEVFKALAMACEDNLQAILENCPPCPDRTHALNKVREARMWANSAIALE